MLPPGHLTKALGQNAALISVLLSQIPFLFAAGAQAVTVPPLVLHLPSWCLRCSFLHWMVDQSDVFQLMLFAKSGGFRHSYNRPWSWITVSQGSACWSGSFGGSWGTEDTCQHLRGAVP